jgi:hypothetical protein
LPYWRHKLKIISLLVAVCFLTCCTPKTRIETVEEFNKFKNQHICRSVQNYIQNVNKGTLEVNFYKENDHDRNKTSYNMIVAAKNSYFFKFPLVPHVILTINNSEKIRLRGVSANDTYSSSYYSSGYYSYGIYHPGHLNVNNLYVSALIISVDVSLIQKIANAQSISLDIEGVADELTGSFSNENFLAVRNFLNRCR